MLKGKGKCVRACNDENVRPCMEYPVMNRQAVYLQSFRLKRGKLCIASIPAERMKRARLLAAALSTLFGVVGCAELPRLPSLPAVAGAVLPGSRQAPTAQPQPRPGNTAAARLPYIPASREAANPGKQAAAPERRPSSPAAESAPRTARQQRAANALSAPAPQACMAADAVKNALPLLPVAERETLQRLLGDGAALGAERAQWRTGVRDVKLDVARLRMGAPGFGCMNPGLGDMTQNPGRATEGTMWADVDCVAEAKGNARGITPAFMSADERQKREAVTVRIQQLKEQDPVLTQQEQSLAMAQAELLSRAARHWQQSAPQSWTLADLAGMEKLSDQMGLACTARQARATPASDALMQQVAQTLPEIFDAVLPLHASTVTAVLAKPGTGAALRTEMKSLFPTAVLDQRARRQPWLADALQKEEVRVAGSDAKAQREAAVQSAERSKKVWEQSPEFLERQANLRKAAANTAPTSDEMAALVVDYLIADRENKFAHFDREGNRLIVTQGIPMMGSVQAYLGEVNITRLQCKAKDRKQLCELEYTESSLGRSSLYYQPTGAINRQHSAEFSWSEHAGLQSPGLKAAIAQAHKDWHARVDVILQQKADVERAMDQCKGGLPANPTARDRQRCAGRF